jgi:tetratricopeptide (TPR) repeat protein
MPKGIGGFDARCAVRPSSILVFFASLALCAIAIAQPAATRTETRFSRTAENEIVFQEGLLRYQNKQLAEAETNFRTVIKADPADSEAYYYLGLAQVDQNKSAEAIESFNQSLSLDPTRTEVRAARATANIRAGRYDAAREDLDRLAPDPRWDSLVHYLRGQLAYAEGNLDVAASEFAQAKAAGGTEAEPAGFYEGLTYLRMRQLVRARATFKETTIDPERDPTVAAAARQLDAVLSQQGGPSARKWAAQVTLSYVYDSNVIQLGANSTLPSGISDESDSRVVIQPSGSYSFIRNDKVDIGIEAAGYFAFQFDLNSFDIASYQIGPYVNYRLAENVYASMRYAFNYITLGHDSYLNRNIVTPQLTFIEPNFGYTSAYYQFEARQFADEFSHQFDHPNFDVKNRLDRDGQNHTLGLVQGINLPELFAGAGRANMEVNYRLIDQETHGSDYDGLFNQVGVTLYTPLPFWNLKADVGVSYEIDKYRHGNSLDSDGDTRSDEQWIATAGVQRQIFKNCTMRVDYNYTNNNSNVRFGPGAGSIDVFDYDRHQVAVRLIYAF